MRVWVTALAEDNAQTVWADCRNAGLWGADPHRAGSVSAGDEFFVWWSGRGWHAHCEFTSDATPGGPQHPPDWRCMRWVSEFRVLKELPSPQKRPSKGNREPLSGLYTVQLGQFTEVTDRAAIARLRALFK